MVDAEHELERRLAALEEQMERLRVEVVARRLVVVDDLGRTRLVVRPSDDATELRLLFDGLELLLFVVHGRDGWARGAGVQVWDSGNIVHEHAWWEDAS